MKAAPLALVVCVAGCFVESKPIGPFVHSVEVDGYDLVLEECMIATAEDTPEPRLAGCHTVRRHLPVTTGLARSLTTVQLAYAVTADARASVARCGARDGISGTLRLHIAIDYAGRLLGVRQDLGSSGFSDCAHRALAPVSFPRSLQGVEDDVTFELPQRP